MASENFQDFPSVCVKIIPFCPRHCVLSYSFFRWSYKPKGVNVYQLITEGVKQENSETRDCNFKGLSSIPIVMTEELDEAVFICATSGELGGKKDRNKYDEVLLQLHRKYIFVCCFVVIIPRHLIVARYYGFTLDGRVSVRPSVSRTSIRPAIFRFRMITWVNINGFSPNLVCALILWRSGLG